MDEKLVEKFDHYWTKYKQNYMDLNLSVCDHIYYIKHRTASRRRRLEDSTISAFNVVGWLDKDLSNISVLDIGVGNPFWWDLMNDLFKIKNFDGIDLLPTDVFEKLLLNKDLYYNYYEYNYDNIHSIKELKNKKYDLIVCSPDRDDYFKYLPFMKDICLILYNHYTQFRYYENGVCVKCGKVEY
jgi:hypothetical protein